VVNSRFFAPAVVFGLFLLLASPVLAQEATPAASPAGAGGELDLVAMALSTEDLPPGYLRFWGGVLAPGEVYGDVFASHLPREQLAATGHLRSYEDNYGVWNSGEFVHIFIDEYASAEGAAQGFEIFEDESNTPPDETVLSMEDRPLPGVGEEPSELTVGSVMYEDGTFSQFVGSAFRIGNLNAGVVLEYLTFPDESGTPVATPASAAGPDPEQVQLVEEMSAKLAARMEAVLAGETPSGVDPELAAKVLPIQQSPNAWHGISWEGYEASETMIGFEGAFTRFAPDYRSGFSRMIMMGTGDDFPPPYVSVGVSEFASPTAANDVLNAIRETPGDLPTPAVSPRGAKRELVDDPTIPGADAALAFRSALDEEDPDAPFDSAGVDFVVGPYLVTVDVQGVDSAETAMAAAKDLAMQQAACLTAEGPCAAASVPALMAPSEAAPAAATPEA
jgi:hypothetical protein